MVPTRIRFLILALGGIGAPNTLFTTGVGLCLASPYPLHRIDFVSGLPGLNVTPQQYVTCFFFFFLHLDLNMKCLGEILDFVVVVPMT